MKLNEKILYYRKAAKLSQEELGLAPAASPLGGIEGFFLGFATVILVLGVVTMIAGAALAVYLYQKGNKKP